MSGLPTRVLHIVRAMNCGGVETWLMHLLRLCDPQRVKMDFLVHTSEACAFDDEILERGACLTRCPKSWRDPGYGSWFYSWLSSERYDVVHSHVHHFSGFLLMLARLAGVSTRIAHSHNDTTQVDGAAGWMRSGYQRLMQSCIRSHATDMVATSSAAGQALFGHGWKGDPRSAILCCGVDLAPLRRRLAKTTAKAALGIGPDELVIGHVGRLVPQKNHAFLLKIAAALLRRTPGARLLVVGDGPLRAQLQEQSRMLGIASKAIFTGQRADVPNLLSALDVFVFPSLYEGLGLSIVEAQACGLPCVISDVVPQEVNAIPELIHRASLAAGAEDWASLVWSAAGRAGPGPVEAMMAVEKSRLNIANSVDSVYALYGARAKGLLHEPAGLALRKVARWS